MSNKGNAYVLATALYARNKSLILGEIGDNLYDCVEALGYGSDERKADLYAQLAERLQANMLFSRAVLCIEVAMDSTDRRFPRG